MLPYTPQVSQSWQCIVFSVGVIYLLCCWYY